jgi:diguanylate cyclase (GGDEF)-like protein
VSDDAPASSANGDGSASEPEATRNAERTTGAEKKRGGSPGQTDQGLSDGDQTLSDSDQTLSDSDQTLSDSDQTLSDREQQASDEDQAAADREVHTGAGSDAYARTTAVRTGTARERLEVGDRRNEVGAQRDLAARERDEIADQRDIESGILAQRARALDGDDGAADRNTVNIEAVRTRAAKARSRAALDRERATEDRKLALCDRELAARDREQASDERDRAGADELTSARRRGVGLEELQREIDRSRRTGENLVGVYVDVDGLKRVNDKNGHAAGDEVLREVVAHLKQNMRPYDLVIRLGGDEFFCVLPGVDAETARGRFEDMDTGQPSRPSAASISIGLSELREGEEAQQLIEHADQELLDRRASRTSRQRA